MIVVGIDAHKRTHTAIVVNQLGRTLATKTTGTTSKDNLTLLRWATEHDNERIWAVEDCRNMTRRLEQDLLAASERIVRVTPKLMAATRDSARTYGKSDPINALAVARAALREPDLPTAQLDGPERDMRLLTDHREALISERTRAINRLRWRLHELDPQWDPTARSLDRVSAYNTLTARLDQFSTTVARLAEALVEHCLHLTAHINQLEAEITTLAQQCAPTLLTIPGCGPLTAAKILGETADIRRFRSRDTYARHNGTAPLPVWSSNRARHPTQSYRQPSTQRRPTPHRPHPSPLPP
ncbi:transposase [Kibdelosporangium phytohabitans]|nr:IS110 family transposase [Kibdelosporangium phytohabitans]MBE1470806.1 transposase [Kibdelosporangium phytohabitans]